MQPTGQPKSKVRAILVFVVVCSLGLGADLFTKWLAFDHPSTRLFDHIERDDELRRWDVYGADEQQVVVLPKLLHFHATVNEGAVFGLGQGQQTLFVIVSIGAIAFLLLLVTRTRSWFEVVLLGCLLAGVLGNMYDRIRFNYVRDMIFALPGVSWPGTWQLPGLHYPGPIDRLVFPYIFNVADCLLVCGVTVLLVRSFFVAEKKVATDDTDDHRLKTESVA